MARSRNLKPGFFTNEILAEIDPLGRLLFQGLWCLADRKGRLEDRPKRLKAEILPYDACDVDELLNALANRGFIVRYSVGGQRFIQVLNFAKHQNPHVKEAPSSIPAPDEHHTSPVLDRCKPDANTGISGTSPADSLLLIPDSFNPLPKPHRSPARTGSLPDGFEAFWSTYPCKKAKTKAVKVWESLNPDAQLLAAILTGIERDKQSDQWQRDDGRFIPHPVTWLNGRRWEDETGNANASTSPSAWWELSGFSSEAEAIDAGCQQWNWREFSAGKRIEGVTA